MDVRTLHVYLMIALEFQWVETTCTSATLTQEVDDIISLTRLRCYSGSRSTTCVWQVVHTLWPASFRVQ